MFAGVAIVGARPGAYERLVEARPARRTTSCCCGPAVAVGGEPGGPRAVDADEWELETDVDGRVRVSNLQPRATAFVRTPTAVRGELVDGGVAPDDRVKRGIAMTRALISADNHVFEPVTLWQERLPTGFRDRGPRVETRDGWIVMAIEGMPDRKLTAANGAASGERRGRGDARARACAPAAPTPTAACATWRSTASSPR